MKKIILFLFVIFILIVFSFRNNNLTQLYGSKISDAINLKDEIIADIKGSAHGIVMDSKNNIYVGKTKEILKVGEDKRITSFAILDDAYAPENVKTCIYDIEFNTNDNCFYAASHDKILKITLDGKMSTYIQEDFPGRYGAVGIEFDNEENMYIACDNKIYKYSKDKKKTLFLDGSESKKIEIDLLLGLEFDSTFKNLYFCERANGQLIKCAIKNGKSKKLYTVFHDMDYATEYVALIDDETFVVKDPSYKYFYLIDTNKKNVTKINVEVKQKYIGIETIIYKDKIIYGTNYDGQTLHKIILSDVLN